MSFENLKDFKELKIALDICEDPKTLCSKCPYAKGEKSCSDRRDEGIQKAIDLAIKYLEKQEKEKENTVKEEHL